MLYNKKKQRGFLYNKFNKKPKREKAVVAQENSLNQTEHKLLMQYLKNVVVANEETALKSKLFETVFHRLQLIKKERDEYIKTCNFYFTAPGIVSITSISKASIWTFFRRFLSV